MVTWISRIITWNSRLRGGCQCIKVVGEKDGAWAVDQREGAPTAKERSSVRPQRKHKRRNHWPGEWHILSVLSASNGSYLSLYQDSRGFDTTWMLKYVTISSKHLKLIKRTYLIYLIISSTRLYMQAYFFFISQTRGNSFW